MNKFQYATVNGLSVTISDATTPEEHADAIFDNEIGKHTKVTVIHIHGFSTPRDAMRFCSERGYRVCG